jgi:Spy/CpxP family protein refolding chaperone
MKTALFSVMAIFMLSALAFAAQGKAMNDVDSYHGSKMGQWYDQLSQEQQETLQKIHDKYFDQLRDMRLQLRAKKAALHAQVMGSSPDQAQVDALVSEINELRSQLLSTKVKMQMEKRANDLPIRAMGMHRQGMRDGSGCPMMNKKMHGGKMMNKKGMGHGGHGMGQEMMQGQDSSQSAN